MCKKYDSNPGKVHNLRVGPRPAVHIWSEEEEPTSSSADAYDVAGGGEAIASKSTKSVTSY